MSKSLYTKENDRLIAWLKVKRRESDMTMRELAKLLGVSHSFVGKVEQGERRLDVVEFVRYCRALGVSPIDGMKATFDLE